MHMTLLRSASSAHPWGASLSIAPSLAAIVLLSILPIGAAAAPRVPKRMLGTWAHGSCRKVVDRLVITSTTAALGVGKPARIEYQPDDEDPGRGAIHWDEEYVVDNFVYEASLGVIIHNTQGFHMPGQVVYKRCAADG